MSKFSLPSLSIFPQSSLSISQSFNILSGGGVLYDSISQAYELRKNNFAFHKNRCYTTDMDIKKEDEKLKSKLSAVLPYLNERQRRILIAAEANALGYGGIARLARITGVSRPTIGRGQRELRDRIGVEDALKRARAKRSGRKKSRPRTQSIEAKVSN